MDQVKAIKRITRAEWIAQATELFGPDPRHWRFQCPKCKEGQSMQEFMDAGVESADTLAYFSCIGRFVENRGCDWTLGGLFQVHTTEVMHDNNEVVPVFEFYPTIKL